MNKNTFTPAGPSDSRARRNMAAVRSAARRHILECHRSAAMGSSGSSWLFEKEAIASLCMFPRGTTLSDIVGGTFGVHCI